MSSTLKDNHDFLCQIFVKWIKIIGKNFENVCRNSVKFRNLLEEKLELDLRNVHY